MNNIRLIAQNFDIYDGDGLDQYARTGDVSLEQLNKAGAEGVIIGHSEVGDSPEVINKKLLSILKFQKLNPGYFEKLIILIGESWKEFENNDEGGIASLMYKKCEIIFDGISEDLLNDVIVGYEPKWGSFGSGKKEVPPPEPKFISECIKNMRQFFKDNYSDDLNIYFIYGGRSTPERTELILKDNIVDGLILGSACNSVEKTLAIAKVMDEVCKDRKKVLISNFKAYNLSDPYEKYLEELRKLSDEFILMICPPHTELAQVKELLKKP